MYTQSQNTWLIKPSATSNDFAYLGILANAGIGVVLMPKKRRSEQLVQVLPHWHSQELNIYMILPSRRGITL